MTLADTIAALISAMTKPRRRWLIFTALWLAWMIPAFPAWADVAAAAPLLLGVPLVCRPVHDSDAAGPSVARVNFDNDEIIVKNPDTSPMHSDPGYTVAGRGIVPIGRGNA